MEKSWVGSWKVKIELPNLNMVSRGLITFFTDGNLIASEIPYPQETAGHGSWAATGLNQCDYAFAFYVGSAEMGKWQEGCLNCSLAYDSGKDMWSGPFQIKMVDQDGVKTFDETGTMSGTRIGSKI